MKKLTSLMKVVFFMMAIFAFVGCPQEAPVEPPVEPPVVDGGDSTQGGDSSTNGETTPDYSAKVSVESIELVSGGSTTFTVTSKDGSWVVFDEDLDADQISVVLKDGVCTVTSLKNADYNGSIILYESEERADDIVIPFTITYPYVDVKINFSEFTLTQDDVLTVHYGNKENSKFEDVTATISEDGKSAIAKFKKELANVDFWYNDITFSATIGEETIALRPAGDTKNYFCYTDTKTWPNGVILTIEKTPEGPEYMPVTINLENIENVETVEVTYGYDGIDYVAAEVTLNEDKTQATTSLSSDYKNGSGWLEIKVVLKDADGNVITGYQSENYGNGWFEFKTSDIEFKLYNVIIEGEQIPLVEDSLVEFSGNPTEFISKDLLADKNIATMTFTVTYTKGTGGSWNWVNFVSHSDWSNKTIALNSQTEIEGSITIIDAVTIAAYKENGILIAGENGDSATVTVSYTTE